MGNARRAALGGALLVMLTLAAYQPVLTERGGFAFVNADDDELVVDNPQVTGGLTRDGVRWAFTSIQHSNWFPLTWISLQLDAQLHGVEPWGFHLTNVLLHVANVVLLFLVLLGATGRFGPSFLAAGLFAVHPLHVESVAWVSERKDVLSTFFGLLAIAAWVAYAARPGWRRYLLVAVCFALSLMSKSMLVTLPCVLLLLDFWPLDRARSVAWPRLVGEKLPLLAMAAVACVLNLRAQDRMMEVLAPLPLSARLQNALVYYVAYAARTLWPARLVLFRPNPGGALPWPMVLGAAVLLAATSALVFRLRSERRYLPVGWLWFLGTLVPVIGVVQIGLVATADHYTYVPLIGLFVMVAFGGRDLIARVSLPRYVLHLSMAIPLLACVLVTRHQLGHWRNSVALWQHVVDVTPTSALARSFLGRALDADGRANEADAQFGEAGALDPGWKTNLEQGLELEQQGKLWESRRALEAVLMTNPHQTTALEHLARQFENRGELEDAVRHYSTLARIAERAGQRDEAVRMEEALRRCSTARR